MVKNLINTQIRKIPHKDKVQINVTSSEVFYFNSESISNWLDHGIIAQVITSLFESLKFVLYP